MSETIAITGKSVKLFKGHYTSPFDWAQDMLSPGRGKEYEGIREIVGLTGSVLASYHELDRSLNPELLTVPVRDTPLLDPFTLCERLSAAFWCSPAPKRGRC
ncbi:MAG: hypothetical protein ACREYE_09340 [Gammaproteobacteria bacterium]